MKATEMCRVYLVGLVSVLVANLPLIAEEGGVPVPDRRISYRVKLRHPGIDGNALRDYTLHQLVNREGVVTGYTMTVKSVMCESGDCQVAKVHMTWDATGTFTDYAMDEGAALEKAVWQEQGSSGTTQGEKPKGVPFTGQDYKKLDEILTDKKSILGAQNWDAVGSLSGSGGSEVDALTGATPATLRRSVVNGAALTCYHLWHWANGAVMGVARELTHEKCDKRLLQTLLRSAKTHHNVFALEHLSSHKIYDDALEARASAILREGDKEAIGAALVYIAGSTDDQDHFGDTLAKLYSDCSPARRIQLVGELDLMKDLPESLLEGIGAVLVNADRYYEVHLFLRLLEKYEYSSDRLLTDVAGLLTHKNFFIARRAYWFLTKQDVDEDLETSIRAFREKSEAEGRILE